MKLLIGTKYKIDFGAPLPLDEKRIRKLITYFEKEFEPVEIDYSNDFRTNRLGDQARFPCSWSKKECAMLLKVESNERLEEVMGRSWMAIVMQRMYWLPDFELWLHKKGLALSRANEELIDEYLKEQEKEKETRRKERSKYADVLFCSVCFRYYPESRMKNPKISQPMLCDYDAESLSKTRVLKTDLEDMKKRGHFEEKYEF